MNQPYRIDVGPTGFLDPQNDGAHFKVKPGQPIEFRLVDGAERMDIQFTDPVGPFGINPLCLRTEGPGPLQLLPAAAGRRYAMEARQPTSTGDTLTVMGGTATGELDVEPK